MGGGTRRAVPWVSGPLPLPNRSSLAVAGYRLARFPSVTLVCPQIVYTDLDVSWCKVIARTVGQPREYV
jgi:hypothetical protein